MEKLRKHIEEIIPITDEEFESIKPFFTIRRVLKNQYLIQQGDDAKYEYIIMSGIFRVFYLDEDGKEHIVQFATENWWMSDYIAYFNQKPANMYVVCMEPGEVLCLTLEGREQLSVTLHKMEHFFRVKNSSGYVALQQRILSLLTTSPKERFEQFSRQYPQLGQRLSKTIIAAYLGISRETLSRLSAKTVI